MSGDEARPFIAVLHGVNLDQLGKRDSSHYGSLTLAELETQVAGWGRELGFDVGCFQTNHEGEFVEKLHALRGDAAGLILNPGAWTHYAYALHDALEISGLPAIEIHLSDIDSREAWRHQSVIRPLCLATVAGKGPDGYREALELLGKELEV
jgi:3-dehydroquinate dehydratase II